MTKEKIPDWLRAAVQLAMLGEITPNIRMICGSISTENVFTLKYYFANQPTEDDLENVSLIGVNLDSSLGTTTFKMMLDECVFSDEPFGAIDTLDGVFYARKES